MDSVSKRIVVWGLLSFHEKIALPFSEFQSSQWENGLLLASVWNDMQSALLVISSMHVVVYKKN